MNFSRLILPTALYWALALITPNLITAADQVAPPRINHILQCPNDSVWYSVKGERGYISLTALGAADTTKLPSNYSIIIGNVTDSIVVSPDSLPINIQLVGATTTTIETIIFYTPLIELLRQYASFGDIIPENLPVISYASPENPNLTELRNTYRLDEVAGNGDEISKLLNMLEWAHTIVRHDGNSSNPSPYNSLNLIRICKEEDRGVNCRMMATILNEAYLSLGYRSRLITCKPFDKEDGDCHVINTVFAESLDKWIWIDPTFGVYVLDSAGNYLSIPEVRAALIAGVEIMLPEQMDWNGAPKDHTEYLEYMTKNLFRFSSPAGNEFGYESRDSLRQWICLNPVGYDLDLAGTVNTKENENWTTEIYSTNNEESFWQK